MNIPKVQSFDGTVGLIRKMMRQIIESEGKHNPPNAAAEKAVVEKILAQYRDGILSTMTKVTLEAAADRAVEWVGDHIGSSTGQIIGKAAALRRAVMGGGVMSKRTSYAVSALTEGWWWDRRDRQWTQETKGGVSSSARARTKRKAVKIALLCPARMEIERWTFTKSHRYLDIFEIKEATE